MAHDKDILEKRLEEYNDVFADIVRRSLAVYTRTSHGNIIKKGERFQFT